MVSDEHDPKHCVAMFEKLSEYIDGELDGLTRRQIEKHIDGCLSCKYCLATLKKTVKLCKGLADDPVPESFHLKLKEMLLQNMSESGPRAQKR
jgi:anti-sigma factor RsiW